MKIKALYIEPSEHPRVIEIEREYGAEAIIGDDIEYTLPFDTKVMFATNSMGKILGKPLNRVLRTKTGEIFDIIADAFLILGTRGDKTVSLTQTLIKKYTEMFQEPVNDEEIPDCTLFQYYRQYFNAGYAIARADSEALDATFLLRGRNKERGRLLINKYVSIPYGWREVPEQMFWGCKGCGQIAEVDIPFGVTKIGNAAFLGCVNLADIKIPESLIEIESMALHETAWLDKQSDGVVYAGRVAYAYKGDMPEIADIILQDGTVSITGDAFGSIDGFDTLERLRLTIPKSVVLIGERQFVNCAEDFRHKVVIRCEENSFAHAYAKENGIAVELF